MTTPMRSAMPNPAFSRLFELEYPQSIGVFGTYDEAQKAVDHLADQQFPVNNIAIVGTDLRLVERVTGRKTWGTVLAGGVQSGISTGLMIAILMYVFNPGSDFLAMFVTALVIGVVIGVLFALIGNALTRGRRDFTSVTQTVATKYEVLCEHKVAGQARQLLAGMDGARAAQFDPRVQQPGVPPQPGMPPQPGAQPWPPQQQWPAPPPQQQAWGVPTQQPWPGQPPQQPWPGQAPPPPGPVAGAPGPAGEPSAPPAADPADPDAPFRRPEEPQGR